MLPKTWQDLCDDDILPILKLCRKDNFKYFHMISPSEVKVVVLGLSQEDCHRKNIKNNIVKEICREYGIVCENVPKIDLIESMIKLGVLILTTSDNSDLSIGSVWNVFVDHIIKKLQDVVLLCLGKRVEKIYPSISAGHPSSLNRSNPFIGSDCFKRVNEKLTEKIDWSKLVN